MCITPPLLSGAQVGGGHDDAIGVLALDEKGELKPDKVGKPSAGKGAGIGAVAALVTPVGLVAGLVGGGLLGSLHHMNLGLGKAERARPGSELEGGKAAVGVLVPLADASFMVEKLASMGGAPETHQVSADAVAGTHEGRDSADGARLTIFNGWGYLFGGRLARRGVSQLHEVWRGWWADCAGAGPA